MLRQSLLAATALILSMGAQAHQAPFVPYGAAELEKITPEQKRQEMLVFTSDLYDFLAEEILFKSDDSELYQFYLSKRNLCLESVRENPLSFFSNNAKIMYLKKDFNQATNPAYMKCIERVAAAFNQNPKMRDKKGFLRPEIDVESILTLQANKEFMERMTQRHPQNFLVKFNMGVYQAAHFLKDGDVPVPVAFPAQPAPPTPEEIAAQQVQQSQEPSRSMGLLIILGLLTFVIGLGLVLARRSRG